MVDSVAAAFNLLWPSAEAKHLSSRKQNCCSRCAALSLQGAAALEAAQKVRVVVFDKTGTLTQGKPAVTDHKLFSAAHSEGNIMRYAAAAEASSEHPVAQAILEYAHPQIQWPSAAGEASPMAQFEGEDTEHNS